MTTENSRADALTKCPTHSGQISQGRGGRLDSEYTTSRGRVYSFDGWPTGGRPTELFDAGKWAECLHASIFAASRRGSPADLEDDGPLHELAHLVCGVPICTHSTMDKLRRDILDLEQSVDDESRADALTDDQVATLTPATLATTQQGIDGANDSPKQH